MRFGGLAKINLNFGHKPLLVLRRRAKVSHKKAAVSSRTATRII
jgi:hypothetical protein